MMGATAPISIGENMLDRILSLVKQRAQYIKKIGGTSEANIESTNDAIEEIGYISDEIMQFVNFNEDESGELRKLMIEAAASIIAMTVICDEDKLWRNDKSLFEKVNDGKMDLPSFINGGRVGGPVFGPGNNDGFIPSSPWGIEDLLRDLSQHKMRS
jgi:hypothetical protein